METEYALAALPAQRSNDLSLRVADALDAVDEAALVALVQELVAVPGVTGSAAESEAQHLLERRLRTAGMDTDLWSVDLPETVADPAFPGMEAGSGPSRPCGGATAATWPSSASRPPPHS